MPVYVVECPECGQTEDYYSTVDERNNYKLMHCDKRMKRIITAALVTSDIQPYMAVGGDMAGKFITSRREHREYLKRNRFTEVGNEPIRPIKNDFRPKKGEIAEELKKVLAQR